MGSMLYLAGQYANFLKRGTVTSDPSPLTEFSLQNLSDDDPGNPTIFETIVSNSHIDLQTSALVNRGFESALTVGWVDTSIPGGSATRVSVGTHPAYVSAGSYGCSLVSAGTGNYGEIRQGFVAAAGEHREMSVYAKTIAGAPTLRFVLYNARTGRYWNGSAWTTSSTVTPTGTLTGSFSKLYVRYQVESYDACGGEAVEIVVYIRNMSAAASTLAIDDTLDSPGINFCGVFGHNLGDVSNPTVQYDETNGYVGAEVVASSQTVRRGAFYSTFDLAFSPYWRFVIGGSNWAAPHIGELVLGQARTCVARPEWGLIPSAEFPGPRGRSPGGRFWGYNLSSEPSESIAMDFLSPTAATGAELAELWMRSAQGRYPTVIVPSNDEASVFYGRLEAPYAAPRIVSQAREISFHLIGDPLPLVGA